jgi:hypothetical protein
MCLKFSFSIVSAVDLGFQMLILGLKINIQEILFFSLISKEVFFPSKCLVKQISNDIIYKLIKK